MSIFTLDEGKPAGVGFYVPSRGRTHRGLLGEDFKIIIIGRREYTNEDYIGTVDEWLRKFARLEVRYTWLATTEKALRSTSAKVFLSTRPSSTLKRN